MAVMTTEGLRAVGGAFAAATAAATADTASRG